RRREDPRQGRRGSRPRPEESRRDRGADARRPCRDDRARRHRHRRQVGWRSPPAIAGGRDALHSRPRRTARPCAGRPGHSPMRTRNFIETILEAILFNSRWLLAPAYLGLIVSLGMLLVTFLRELAAAIPGVMAMTTEEIILVVLTLIDLSLAMNLVLIVVFSGYENFVSKIDTGGSEDRPHWMGTLDFSGLKMKLIGSIVAISAISLLRAFMTASDPHIALDQARLGWMIGLHMTFIVSGLLFALMDWVASLTGEKAGPAIPHD